MKQLAFPALILCLLSSCGFITVLKTQNAYYQETADLSLAVDTIPFEFINGAIFLKVSIGGEEKQFVLDSGAGTCIDKKLADSISFKKLGKRKSSGTNGKTTRTPTIILPKFSLGNTYFTSAVASVYDLTHLGNLAKRDVNGIIGANTMNKCAWQLDYTKKIIILTQSPEGLLQRYNADTLSFNAYGRGTPELSLYANNSVLSPVVIDLGSNGFIDINSAHKGDNPFIRKHVLSGSINSVQPAVVDISVLDGISINQELDLQKAQITYMSSLSYGLIGNDFFKDYIVTIDWLNQRLILDPIPHKTENTYHTNYGFFPYLKNSNVYISSIYEGSDIYKAGARLNHQIISYNGINLTDISQEDYDAFKSTLKGSKQSVTLEVLIANVRTPLSVNKVNYLD